MTNRTRHPHLPATSSSDIRVAIDTLLESGTRTRTDPIVTALEQMALTREKEEGFTSMPSGAVEGFCPGCGSCIFVPHHRDIPCPADDCELDVRAALVNHGGRDHIVMIPALHLLLPGYVSRDPVSDYLKGVHPPILAPESMTGE